ncbi:hypothetical protein [Streptomyces sp. NPDC051109]|uniref:hypothetical protein n=1 Tax=Streptomyces sp. NPDC051109 TaxID=3365642 RepID=UPI0010654CCB
MLSTTAMAWAAVSALGDKAQAGTAAQAYAAADVPTPSAAEVSGRPQDAPGDGRHPTHPLRDGRGLRADHVSNRPHYDARPLGLQRADGRATQAWTDQKVG